MQNDELRWLIALLSVPKIGKKTAKNLIAYCGSPSAVFRQNAARLARIPGVGEGTARNIVRFDDFEDADKEVEFVRKHNIRPVVYSDEGFPRRLKELPDAPALLFYKGDCDLNYPRMLAVVGTRKATPYGRRLCEELIAELQPYDPVIVSGLAFGVDITAHKAALENGLRTMSVLAHGLDRIYPPAHTETARTMLREGGGLITEYRYGSEPSASHFPERNRIVAGMTDGVLVVESRIKGGAMITANLGFDYDRDVFALPGRATDKLSEGCNFLIKRNKALLVQSGEDIAEALGWEKTDGIAVPVRQEPELEGAEKLVYDALKPHDQLSIDKLCEALDLRSHELSVILLNMEIKGVVKPLPGSAFTVV